MYALYHKDRVKNTTEKIGEFSSYEEIAKAADEYLEKIQYKSYYWRTWGHDGEYWIDYGSHTKFFVWKEV